MYQIFPRLFLKEIFMEPFVLTSKVRSPSHFFRSPGSNLPWPIQGVGEDWGGGVKQSVQQGDQIMTEKK